MRSNGRSRCSTPRATSRPTSTRSARTARCSPPDRRPNGVATESAGPAFGPALRVGGGIAMHAFDETTEELARLIMAYAGRRIANPVPLDGPAPAAELARRAGQTITPEGVGGAEALRVW